MWARIIRKKHTITGSYAQEDQSFVTLRLYSIFVPFFIFLFTKITGAGNGVGRELAIQFAELGATVICWDSDARRNNSVIDEIRSKDGDVRIYLKL